MTGTSVVIPVGAGGLALLRTADSVARLAMAE
jgi:hypothetical protein